MWDICISNTIANCGVELYHLIKLKNKFFIWSICLKSVSQGSNKTLTVDCVLLWKFQLNFTLFFIFQCFLSARKHVYFIKSPWNGIIIERAQVDIAILIIFAQTMINRLSNVRQIYADGTRTGSTLTTSLFEKTITTLLIVPTKQVCCTLSKFFYLWNAEYLWWPMMIVLFRRTALCWMGYGLGRYHTSHITTAYPPYLSLEIKHCLSQS